MPELHREAFVGYLKDLHPEAICGYARSACGCPITRYLCHLTGVDPEENLQDLHVISVLSDTWDHCFIVNTQEFPLPEWARDVVAEVDALDSYNSITAEHMLSIMEDVA